MIQLHAWYVALPWHLAMAILFGSLGTLSLIVAWAYDRNQPNKREARLARQRRRRRVRALNVLREPDATVRRDAYIDRRGIHR